MNIRHRPFVFGISLLAALLLSGTERQAPPEVALGPFTPPTVFFEVSAYLRSQSPQLGEEQIADLARTILVTSHRVHLDPRLVLAVIHVESSGDRLATSRVGALGLMQLLPTTARYMAEQVGIPWPGPDSLFDPVFNVQLGVLYLDHLVQRFGDLETALAAYNWGPTRIAQRIRNRHYIPAGYSTRVMDTYQRLI